MGNKKKNPDPAKAPVIGIDLGGTKILAAVIDANGKVLSRFKKKTKPEKSPREVISRIADCARGAAEVAGVPLSSIAGIGIGAPGALNPLTGIIALAPNLHWKNIPLKALLEKQLHRPVFLNNDANIGTLGEQRYGAGRGHQNVVGIFIGTGIGAGIIFNGELYEGARWMAGEIGHIPLVENGPLCGCGKKGCLESVASRLAVVRSIGESVKKGRKTILTEKVKDEDLSHVKSQLLADAWKRKAPLVVPALKEAARYIGRGVAFVITFLNPDAVILGGGLIQALDNEFISCIKKEARKESLAPLYKGTKILRARLGDDAGIIGAAAYARIRLRKK